MIISLDDKGSIVEEIINDLTVAPSTILVEQRKRSIPMEQHRSNFEVLLDKLSDDIVVVLHTFFVDRTFAKWENPWPRDGEAERRHAQVLQASKVLLVQVVVGCCDISGGVVGYLVHDTVAEEVPDRWTFAFGVYSALVLRLVVLLSA